MRIRLSVATLLLYAAGLCAAPYPQSARIIRGRKPYAVLVTRDTYKNPKWRKVVEALRAKHRASIIVYDRDVEAPAVLDALRRLFPRYACFVVKPEEADRPFVCAVHRLTRKLDADPYTDLLWGILTGYDAASALKTARVKKPLSCRRALGGTSIPMDVFPEVRWYSEGSKGVMWEKKAGGVPVKKKCPPDTTKAIVDSLNNWKPDVFVTSGHATERDWQIGYSYKNGQLRCREGRIVGIDLKGNVWPVDSPNPKVYLPAGNCLIGRIPDRNCMALAFMKSCGVTQMAGYVVATWYGYAGWGVLEYFFKQPGRFTASESFFCNEQALLWQLHSRFPNLANLKFDSYALERNPGLLQAFARKHNIRNKDALGLLWDRDTLAFYGDPAWEARLLPGPCAWEQELHKRRGVYTVTIKAKKNCTLKRPPVVLFPRRIKKPTLLEGAQYKPVITDNFLLIGGLKTLKAGEVYRVRFRARAASR